MKFSKFFTSLFSYAGLLGPSILTLHILSQSLKTDIKIPAMDDSRIAEMEVYPIQPKMPAVEENFDQLEEPDDWEEDGDGEDDEDVDGEEDAEESPEEEEEPIVEEPEEEEKEPEEKEEEEGPLSLNEDGKLDYDEVAAWAKEALEEYKKNLEA